MSGPRRRRVLEVDASTNSYDWILRGPAGQLITTVTGRPPMYFPARRGYGVGKATAMDCVALAERLGWDVVITGPRTQTAVTVVDMVEPTGSSPRSESDQDDLSEAALW